MPNAQMVALLQQLMAITGSQTGAAIKNAIDGLLNTHNVDVQDLQNKIQVIQDILDADPSTPEFDQAQNIITTLNDILARTVALETAVNTLNGNETVTGSVDQKIAVERARAEAAEQANAQCCAQNQADIAALGARVTDNEADISDLDTRMSGVESDLSDLSDTVAQGNTEVQGAISDIVDAVDSLESRATDLEAKDATMADALGLNQDGTFAPEDPSSDATNMYEYIHDVSTEGADRANTLRRQIRRLARKSKQADEALDARLDILEGDEDTAGSVAAAVKAEKDRAEAAEAGLSQDIADETSRATAAEQALQDQIDNLSGGGTGSIQSVRDEVDATQAGAGLESDGSYAADSTTNYLKDATSLKEADKLLDTEIKGLEDRKADRSEVVLSADIASIDVSALGQVFLDALNCGLSGGTNCDQVNTTPDGGDGDGAVL